MAKAAYGNRLRAADDGRPQAANYHAQALTRGLWLLELLATHPQPLTLADFSKQTGLAKSTLVRLLSVLAEMEYVVRVDDQPSYRIGHKVQRLASAYLSSLDLSVVAQSYLQHLAHEVGQTANLGVLDGNQVLHICVSEPDRPLRFTARVGMRDHAYCTGLGKLLLSQLPAGQLETVAPDEPFPAFTDRTITTLDTLRRDLRRTTRRGYALDDNERSDGLRCVAVPLSIDGQALAAVSVSGPSAEFGATRRSHYVDQLRHTADALADDVDFGAALRITHRSLRAAPPAEASR